MQPVSGTTENGPILYPIDNIPVVTKMPPSIADQINLALDHLGVLGPYAPSNILVAVVLASQVSRDNPADSIMIDNNAQRQESTDNSPRNHFCN